VIDSRTAKKLIHRLNGLPGYPKRSDGEAELVTALMESAQTIQIAQAVIDSLAQHGERCPLPLDIRRECRCKHEAQDTRRKNCELCGGIGFTIKWRLKTQERRGDAIKTTWEDITEDQYCAFALTIKLDPQKQAAYEGAIPCSCRSYVPQQARIEA
jgi:hypothetical protein